MARDGLRLVLGEARARGAEEGRLDAAAAIDGRARRSLIRANRLPCAPLPDDAHPELVRALASLRAHSEMDDRFPTEGDL